MRLNKPTNAPRRSLPIVGYHNRRDGHVICIGHPAPDVVSPSSPWSEIHAGDRYEARDGTTAPIACHDCGAPLEDSNGS